MTQAQAPLNPPTSPEAAAPAAVPTTSTQAAPISQPVAPQTPAPQGGAATPTPAPAQAGPLSSLDLTPPAEAPAAPAAPAGKISTEEFSALSKEFQTTGSLSEASYAKLNQYGFDKATVDAHLAGQKALAQQVISRLHQEVGGQQVFEAARLKSRELPQAEREMVQAELLSQDPERMVAAARYLVFRTGAAPQAPTTPSLMGGSSLPASPAPGFRSQDEALRAMDDPRYATDQAYRDDYARKLEKSEVFKVSQLTQLQNN